MPLVTNTLVDAAGEPLAGYPVRVQLVGQWRADGASEIPPLAVWSGNTDDTGTWSVMLAPQSAYEGTTHYRVIEPNSAVWTITVADAPATQRLRDRIMLPVAPAVTAGIHLDDLVDVATSAVTQGQGLVYGSGGLWAPGTPISVASQVLITGTAAVALPGHRVVTRASDGTFGYASNDTFGHLNAPLWVTSGAVSSGGTVTAQAYGPMEEPTWSWLPGPLYLGAGGLLTQVIPVAPGALFLASVGYATASTSAIIDRQPSIILA